uniref:Uncharacterized protein n=1 Tax=viral metagenome TaxID=1070528 RepID=A0A6C0KC00_9ZZZZ
MFTKDIKMSLVSKIQNKIQEEKEYKMLEFSHGSDALAYILILIGGVLWGIKGISGINPVAIVPFINLVYIVVGIAALYIFRKKFFNQPHKGEMWMPAGMLGTTSRRSTTGQFDYLVKRLKPGMKVVYWAALPSDTVHKTSREAFGDYSNMGVGKVDGEGELKISLPKGKPGKYMKRNKYFIKTTLPSEIYYRFQNPRGYMSAVNVLDANSKLS